MIQGLTVHLVTPRTDPRYPRPLTEDDVRRIVREELSFNPRLSEPK